MYERELRHLPINQSNVLRGIAYVQRAAYLDGKRHGSEGLKCPVRGVPLQYRPFMRNGWDEGRIAWNIDIAFRKLRAERGE